MEIHLKKRDIFLSKDNTDCLKGIFSIFVLFHHIRAQMLCFNDTVIGMLLTALGYLSVGVFLFLSGYGLEVQYQKNGREYIDKMPFYRIIPFYFICIFSILLYVIERLLLGITFNAKDVLQSFIFGHTIVQNGWYLQAIIVIYILYYVAYRFEGKQKKWIVLLVLLGVYCLVCMLFKLPITYYESILGFPVGIFVAQNKNAICEFLLEKNVWIRSVIYLVLFGVTLVLGNYHMLKKEAAIGFKMVSVVFFILITLLIAYHISFVNKITKWLGKRYCEIYIIQGLFISALHSTGLYIKNDWVYFIMVVILTIISASVLRPIFNTIMLSCRKVLLIKM